MKIKFFGFTLAEVLITLGIIGVVAAMTIPTLMNNTNDAEYKTAWKKVYSVFSNAYSQVLNDEGGNLKGSCTDTNDLKNKFKTYLSYTKECDKAVTNGTSQCFYNSDTTLKSYGNNSTYGRAWDAAGFILKDGIMVITALQDTNCALVNGSSNVAVCGWIIVDVNGSKPPNTIGKDVFHAWITENRMLPVGAFDENNAAATNYNSASCDKSNTSAPGWGCSNKFLYN